MAFQGFRERGRSLADVQKLADKEQHIKVILPVLEQLDRNLAHVMKRVLTCEDRLDHHSARLKECLTLTRKWEAKTPHSKREEARRPAQEVKQQSVDEGPVAEKVLPPAEEKEEVSPTASQGKVRHRWDQVRHKVLDKERSAHEAHTASNRVDERTEIEPTRSVLVLAKHDVRAEIPGSDPVANPAGHRLASPGSEKPLEQVIRKPLSADGQPAICELKRQALEALLSSSSFEAASERVSDIMRAAKVVHHSQGLGGSSHVEMPSGDSWQLDNWEPEHMPAGPQPVTCSRSRSTGDTESRRSWEAYLMPGPLPLPLETDLREAEVHGHEGLEKTSSPTGSTDFCIAHRESVSGQFVTGLEEPASSSTSSVPREHVQFADMRSSAWVKNPRVCHDVWSDTGSVDDDKNFKELFASVGAHPARLKDGSSSHFALSAKEATDLGGTIDGGHHKSWPVRRAKFFEPELEHSTEGDEADHVRSCTSSLFGESAKLRTSSDTREVARETIVVEPPSRSRHTSRFGRGSFAAVGNILSDLHAIVHGEILGAHPAVKEIYNSAHTVKLRASVWDVTLFVFYRPLGIRTNLLALVPLCLTIFLQISFLCVVVVCIVGKTDDPATLILPFERWRMSASMHLQEAVCAGDPSLSESFMQAHTFNIYSSYSEDLLGGLQAGPFTSVIVCTAWVLTILKEVGGILDKSLAVVQSARMRYTIVELQVFQTSYSSGFKVLSVPAPRCVWFLVMCVVQCSVAGSLLVAGLQWLISTSEIVELLMNSVALSYIMDLDELIYNVFIPSKLATLIHLLEPFPVNWDWTVLPMRGTVLFGVGIVGISASLSLIFDHLETVTTVRDALCPSELRLG